MASRAQIPPPRPLLDRQSTVAKKIIHPARDLRQARTHKLRAIERSEMDRSARDVPRRDRRRLQAPPAKSKFLVSQPLKKILGGAGGGAKIRPISLGTSPTRDEALQKENSNSHESKTTQSLHPSVIGDEPPRFSSKRICRRLVV